MKLGKETETIEYKKSTGELKEGIISIVAMLNKHNRGELYFGVRNDGLAVGQDVTEKTLRDISQSISNHIEPQIIPSIREVVIDDKSCILVSFEGNNVPYYAYGKVYVRVADEDKIVHPNEIEKFYIERFTSNDKWDREMSDKNTSDIIETALKDYLDKANLAGRVNYTYTDRSDVLNKLGLVIDGNLTNTAKVMFCDNSNLEIQMAIFATDERLTFNDIKRDSGTVLELVALAEKYIKNNMKWRVEFDGSMERKEIPEIPIDAIREALVNSFCHRDYRISQNNEVTIFKNRIEIYNPGTFPAGLTPQDFIEGSERSIKRNPLLAQILYYSKDIEAFGTGLRRITRACENAGVKVDFQILKTGFVVVFYRNESAKENAIVPISADNVPIYADKIIAFLNENGKITNKQAREITGLGATRTKVIFKELCDCGAIVSHGDKRGRYYTLG